MDAAALRNDEAEQAIRLLARAFGADPLEVPSKVHARARGVRLSLRPASALRGRQLVQDGRRAGPIHQLRVMRSSQLTV